MDSELPGILTDMLKSFVALGRTLNLSETTRMLNVTRQTVRRHIAALEELKGDPLFVLANGEYRLTRLGERLLPSAEAILNASGRFVSGAGSDQLSLAHATFRADDGEWFYAQRRQLSTVWKNGVPLIRRGLRDWVQAQGELDSDVLETIRPYMLVHRHRGTEWICVEVGEKSSYATWLGTSWARSAIGLPLHQDPVNSRADRYLIEAYGHVSATGGTWFDHVCARFPRGADEQLFQVNYQRLVMACTFPDGTQAVGTIVARTNSIVIEGLEGGHIPQMPSEELMEFEI